MKLIQWRSWKGCAATVFCLSLLLAFLGWFALGFLPRPPLLEGVSFGKIALDAKGGILKICLADDEKYRLRTNLDSIAPTAISALLCYEDRYFYFHPGVNPFALARAAFSSVFGVRRQGASTITMQVARLRYKLETASISGKLRQIFHALLLERHYSKQEILLAYFTLAPYGGNIEGLEAAARIYFAKPARELTRLECMALAVVPQNPVARNPVSGKDFDEARIRLAALMAEGGTASPLKVRSLARLPFAAPHLSMELLGRPDFLNDQGIARSFIEQDLQKLLERAIANHVEKGRRIGICNAAAILVNTDSMRVCALVGSADFFAAKIQGQVDGTRARRSPGSTLKPFIYALALEQGLIHPRSILDDSPKSFGGYDPENFDKGFRGPLSATDALAASRNLPALLLSEQLAAPGLHGFLKRAHVELPKDAGHYGLALALGGAEVSMRELAGLYAMLANQGIWRPLRMARKDSEKGEALRLLSPESAHLVLRMLEREDLFVRQNGGRLPLRCKTGTSNGYRDAWTAGLCGQYVLIVWVGNFDNRANPAFVGGEAALPLFEEIAGGLAYSRHLRDDLPKRENHLNLQKIAVCKETGDLAIERCSEHIDTLFIPGISPTMDSGILRPILVDKKTGLRACRQVPGETEQIYWEFWPTEQQRIFAQAGKPKPLPPDWLPECRQAEATSAKRHPVIVLPKKNVTYLDDFSGVGAGIPLKASLDAEASFAHWFAGKTYIGKTGPGEIIFWHPKKPGMVELVVVDDQGASARQKCEIEAP
ncbi:MAG: penicillin-binding protein 1C [Desulfovibrio sp.]|jgi:penicillin-binding protein 1C|nr:penicillin-binding protein 1C [Desulfovibrio sp.]